MPTDRADRQVYALLGHELRNPLAAALASISVAAEMTDTDDPRAGFLRQGLQDLGRLSSILTAYLDYGRAAENCRRRALPLSGLLQALQRNHPGSGVVLPDDLDRAPVLSGDEDLLGRTLDNLVENAVHAGASRVEVRFEEQDDRVRIVLQDDGPGVSESVRDRLFDPYVSGRGSTGLGLALAREIAEAHGGSLELVDCERGARFVLTLPVVRSGRGELLLR